MTRECPFDSTTPTPAAARHLDDICTRFERAWKRGHRPRIEDFLNDSADVERSALVTELILLELDYRRALGEDCDAGDYRERFPGLDPTWLDRAIATTSTGATESGVRQWSANPWPEAAGASGATDAVVRSFGDYLLRREIARGGMGVVYEAWQVSLYRRVAIKMILAGDHAGRDHLARFRTEARAVARLQHPHIVQIHEVGEHEGRPYLVLEYVDGGNLAERLAGQPQPAKAAAQFVETLARAVHYAHEQGVVHRDLKPANVLLTADGTPKIADFGLARCLDLEPGPSGSTAVVGTPSYMAPEQAMGRGRSVGAAADVYALGAILYQMLTGRPPLWAPTPLETLQLVASEEPVTPRSLQRSLPRDLETICLMCLRKEPATRYASAEALADDLRRFLRGEPIRARRTGPAGIAWRWCRRHMGVAGLLGVIAVLLVTITVASIISARRYRAIAGEADAARSEALRSASEARAVVGFVVDDLLGAASPGRTRRKPLTILEALANADRSVDSRFAGEPLVEAAVRQALAETYFELGEYEKAERHAERALALRERHQGPERDDTLRAMNTLGRLSLPLSFMNDGRLQRAESLFRRVLEECRRTGRDDEPAWDAMEGLAEIERRYSRHGEAIALQERALASRRQRLGPSAPKTLRTMRALARSLETLGRLSEAEARFREAAETGSRDAPDAYETPGSLFDYARLLWRLGRADEAAAWADRSVESHLRLFGFKHPETLIAVRLAADTKVGAQGVGGAVRFADWAAARARSELGPTDPQTISLLFRRSELLYLMGHLEEAGAGFQAVSEARLEEGSLVGLHLAVVRRDQGATGAARALLAKFREKIVELQDRNGGDRSPFPKTAVQLRMDLAKVDVLTRNLGRPERSRIAPGAPGGPPRLDAPFLAVSPMADGRIAPGEYGDGDGYPFDFTGDDNPGRSHRSYEQTTTSKEPSDLSARLFTAHTASSLFMAVRVRDQYVRVDPVAYASPQYNDSVEVFLDGDRVANDFTPISAGVWRGNHEGFELIADASGNRACPAPAVGKARWKVGTSRTEDGYVVEFEIPLDLIDTQDGPGFRPASTGSELRMNVAVIDIDEAINYPTFYGMLWSEERYCSPGLVGEDVWPVALRLVPAPSQGR